MRFPQFVKKNLSKHTYVKIAELPKERLSIKTENI